MWQSMGGLETHQGALHKICQLALAVHTTPVSLLQLPSSPLPILETLFHKPGQVQEA